MNNTWTNPEGPTPPVGKALADSYGQHSDTLRGLVRHHLVDRALAEHLPAEPQRILDIGGGHGLQARMLTRRGHHVTLLDPDEKMLENAGKAWDHAEYSEGPGSMEFLRGVGEEAFEVAGGGWDVVLCHGVLMYVEEPDPLLNAIARCVKPGGYVSILSKQDTALAMRRGLERDWDGVLRALRTPVEHGNLGTISRGVSLTDVIATLALDHVEFRQWYGVRIFTDHLGDEAPGDDLEQVVEAEWEAGRTDPYRALARLFHLIARAEESER